MILTYSARRVLRALRRRRDNYGGAFSVSLDVLAVEAGVARRTLFKGLNELEAAGYLHRDRGRGTVNVYSLVPRESPTEERTALPYRPRPQRPISRAHAIVKEQRKGGA